jgi:hypothetical protein
MSPIADARLKAQLSFADMAHARAREASERAHIAEQAAHIAGQRAANAERRLAAYEAEHQAQIRRARREERDHESANNLRVVREMFEGQAAVVAASQPPSTASIAAAIIAAGKKARGEE